MLRTSVYVLLGAGLFIATCAQADKASPTEVLPNVVGEESGFPVFESQALRYGQDVWMGTCRNCHERGIADAPVVTDSEAWAPRIAKGKPVLYAHAINGFFGEDDSMMPARGGNDALTDDEVRAAVDYMIAVAIHAKDK